MKYEEQLLNLTELPSKRLAEIIMFFSQYNDPIRKSVSLIIAIEKFKKDKNYLYLTRALEEILKIDDFISYKEDGQYSWVMDELQNLIDFFPRDIKMAKTLKDLIPVIEESAELLAEEPSWLEMAKKLKNHQDKSIW